MQTMPLEMQAARLQLLKRHPYLASMAWALVPVQKPGLGTMAVDQYFRLYYDPGVVNIWTVEELTGVIYHEVNHLLRDHPARMRELEPQRANIACDLEINDDLKKEDVKLPGGGLMPEMFNLPENLLAEEYYDMLDDIQQAGGIGGGDGKDNKDGKDNNGVTDSDTDGGCPKPGAGRCGSCATGQRAPWEDDAPGNGNTEGISRAEAELIRRDVATQIIQASQSRGDVPDYMVRWAKEKLQPKVDWRKELAAVVRGAIAQVSGAVDYSYSRPSRRQGNSKVIFPALRQPVPDVAVVVDTSGSISDDMLAQALAEVSGVLKSCGSRGVTVLSVDASVHTCKKVFDAKQVKLAGGGGTDMGRGLEAATKLKPRPQVVIILTDGYTLWPDTPPKAKVIVGLMSDQSGPAWAKNVKISI